MPGRLLVGCAALAIGLGAPSAASADMSCTHSGPPSNTVTFTTDDLEETLELERVGDEIRLSSEHFIGVPRKKKKGFKFRRVVESVACAPTIPTVTNTDRIRFNVIAESDIDIDVSLEGGPFAPGATAEASGSEIEIEIGFDSGGQSARFIGTEAADEFRFGTRGGVVGVNLNAGLEPVPDVDATMTLANPLSPETLLEWPVAHAAGRGGNDTITTRGGPEFDSPFGRATQLSGNTGDDLLAGDSRRWTLIRGGPGADQIFAAARYTEIDAGGGSDAIIGQDGREAVRLGPGRDSADLAGGKDAVHSLDRRRDRVRCGGHRDVVLKDRKDLLKGCERQLKRQPRRPRPD